jgi:uncharacterized protein YfeS
MSAYYFDNEEGLARETSHPFFVAHASAEFYYDLGDEFSPFGNDAGADILYNLQDWYQEHTDFDTSEFLSEYLDENWPNMLDYVELSEPQQLANLNSNKQVYYDDIDQSIIAIAFGQYKISGTADEQTLAMANLALLRQQYFAEKAGQKEQNPWPYSAQYLQRLSIMEADLAAMANKKAR